MDFKLHGNHSYFVISGGMTEPEIEGTHNLLYSAWQAGWLATYSELNSHSKAQSPDFIRQTLIGGIMREDTVVAVQCYTRFNLRMQAHREHPYFAFYPADIIENLVQNSAGQVMTMEYLYVSPDFRRSKSGVSFASIMCNLGLRLFLESDSHQMLSITRNERKVNEMLYGMGAECLQSSLSLHNVSVDIIGFKKRSVVLALDPTEAQLADELWNNRKSFKNSLAA